MTRKVTVCYKKKRSIYKTTLIKLNSINILFKLVEPQVYFYIRIFILKIYVKDIRLDVLRKFQEIFWFVEAKMNELLHKGTFS